MTNINLIRHLNASVTSSGISEENLAKILYGDIFNNYATISTASTIDIDLGRSSYIDKISLRCLSSIAPTGLAFYVSNNGISYSSVSSMSSSYKMTTYAPSPTFISGTGAQHFSKYTGKMYLIRYNAFQQTSSNDKLHIYNPSTDSWTNTPLGITVGAPCGFGLHPYSNYAYFTPGNSNSNFYRINLDTYVVTPVMPMPQSTASLAGNGSTEAFVVDSVRGRIYRYGMNLSSVYTFTVYDINKNSWTTLTNNAVGRAWMVYHKKLDRIIFGAMSSGNVYQYNPFSNSWSLLETLSSPNTNWAGSYRAGAVYSPKYNLIFVNTSPANVSNQPMQISAYDPTHTKFSGWKTVISDTNFKPSSNFIADPRILAYDEVNDTFYAAQDSVSNAKFSFKDVDLFSHYGNVSGGPYRYVRVSLNIGTVAELKIYANSSSIDIEDTDVYTLNNYGGIGESSTYSFTNNVGTATEAVAFIEPDGSEGSRCTEISLDDINWVSHCVSNDLENDTCTVNNLNYRTTMCGYGCTTINGGSAAEDGFAPIGISFGAVASGIESSFKVRTNIPEGFDNIDRVVKIGVEIKT